MDTQKTGIPTRTKTWTLRVDLFEEGDVTKVHAVLDTGDNRLESHTEAHRNPHDPPARRSATSTRPAGPWSTSATSCSTSA